MRTRPPSVCVCEITLASNMTLPCAASPGLPAQIATATAGRTCLPSKRREGGELKRFRQPCLADASSKPREGCRPEGARPGGALVHQPPGLDSVARRRLVAYGAAARPRRSRGHAQTRCRSKQFKAVPEDHPSDAPGRVLLSRVPSTPDRAAHDASAGGPPEAGRRRLRRAGGRGRRGRRRARAGGRAARALGRPVRDDRAAGAGRDAAPGRRAPAAGAAADAGGGELPGADGLRAAGGGDLRDGAAGAAALRSRRAACCWRSPGCSRTRTCTG